MTWLRDRNTTGEGTRHRLTPVPDRIERTWEQFRDTRMREGLRLTIQNTRQGMRVQPVTLQVPGQ